MRRIYMLAIMAFITELCLAQSTVCYTYDNAGNRVSQEILSDNPDRMQEFGTMGSESDESKGHTIRGHIGSNIIRITIQSEQLRVEVFGLKATDNCQVSIFNTAGQQLFICLGSVRLV